MSGSCGGGGGGGVSGGSADKKLLNLQIKADLFKDVKYYVTGTLQPEVNEIERKIHTQKFYSEFPFVILIWLYFARGDDMSAK